MLLLVVLQRQTLAISKGWQGLVGPILIIGTLGYVIGNYAGTLIYQLLIHIDNINT